MIAVAAESYDTLAKRALEVVCEWLAVRRIAEEKRRAAAAHSIGRLYRLHLLLRHTAKTFMTYNVYDDRFAPRELNFILSLAIMVVLGEVQYRASTLAYAAKSGMSAQRLAQLNHAHACARYRLYTLEGQLALFASDVEKPYMIITFTPRDAADSPLVL